jgi:hypothetical protein
VAIDDPEQRILTKRVVRIEPRRLERTIPRDSDSLAERGHFELASDFDAREPALRLRRGTEKGPSLFEPDP